MRLNCFFLFLTAFFLPFGKIAVGDFVFSNLSPPNISESDHEIEEALENEILAAQKKIIEQLIKKEAPAAEIAFVTDASADGFIYIKQIQLAAAAGVNVGSLEKSITEATGLEIEVIKNAEP